MFQRHQGRQQDRDRARPSQPPHPGQVDASDLVRKRFLLQVPLAEVQPDLPRLPRTSGVEQPDAELDS